MPETAHHLTVGKYKCAIFSDGTLVDKGEEYGLNCIYIASGKHKMLVDNGCGEMFQGNTGHLWKNLEAEGIKRGDITTIIFDHGHIDHVCGTFDKRGKPVFPEARYIISKREWDYIEALPGDNELQNMFFSPARRYLLPLKDRFDLVEDNHEILPGIKLIPAPGQRHGRDIFRRGKAALHRGYHPLTARVYRAGALRRFRCKFRRGNKNAD